MANILLGVTGSVAAMYTPELFTALAGAGHGVKVVATKAACYFFERARIVPGDALILDQDEWPGDRYQRGDPVLHIELRRWADLLLIAPLDANTLAKMALGVCDNCLTCVYRAWDRMRPLVLAPAMNTLMWQHPATGRHLTQIAEDMSGRSQSAGGDVAAQIAGINADCRRLFIVPPATKLLACDEVGMGALADRSAIVNAVGEQLSRS